MTNKPKDRPPSPSCAATSTASTRRCTAADGARRDHRPADRRQEDAGDRLGLPPGARGRHDAPAGRAPSAASCRSTPPRASGASSSRPSPMCRRRSAVHADLSAGEAAMRDTARFHFGFTVPFVAASSARPAWSRRSPASQRRPRPGAGRRGRRAGAWWTRARGDERAEDHRAAAIRRARRPSGRAAGVRASSRAAADAMVPDVEVWSVRVVRLGRRRPPARSARSPRWSRCRTAPSTARRCWSRCRTAATSTEITAALVKAGASVRSSGPRRQPRDPLYRAGATAIEPVPTGTLTILRR